VVDAGVVVGMLTRPDLIAALSRLPGTSTVESVMQRDVPMVDAADMMDAAFRRLQGCSCRTMPVMRRGTLVGLLTMENVGEFISVQTAMDHSLGRPRPPGPSLARD